MAKSSTEESKVISTIKLSKATKERLGHLKVYQRETFDEILQKMLGILNLARVDPERAQMRLVNMDRMRKRSPKEIQEMKQVQKEIMAQEMEENETLNLAGKEINSQSTKFKNQP